MYMGLAFVPEANVGDVLLIHSGQAFRILDPGDEGAAEVTGS